VIAWYYFYITPFAPDSREILMISAIMFYSIRLTSNFYRDWPGLSKEDFRYVNFRKKFPHAYWPVSFMAVHFFPTVMVFLACLPMYGIYESPEVPLNGFDYTGVTIIIFAVILAFIADEQLRLFKEEKENAGKTIQSGLWKICRHPNYLGEILTWWGLYLLGLGAGLQWWWTGVGAAAITVMFVFASIPLMEERMMITRSDYPLYKSRTPMLIPFIK
jgi:steroid 5-alpha reductase family enzyme